MRISSWKSVIFWDRFCWLFELICDSVLYLKFTYSFYTNLICLNTFCDIITIPIVILSICIMHLGNNLLKFHCLLISWDRVVEMSRATDTVWYMFFGGYNNNWSTVMAAKWRTAPVELMLFLISNAVTANVLHQDAFYEELFVKSMANGHVLNHFQFTTLWNSSISDDNTCKFKI